MHACIHACIHAYMHTYIYIYMYNVFICIECVRILIVVLSAMNCHYEHYCCNCNYNMNNHEYNYEL